MIDWEEKEFQDERKALRENQPAYIWCIYSHKKVERFIAQIKYDIIIQWNGDCAIIERKDKL